MSNYKGSTRQMPTQSNQPAIVLVPLTDKEKAAVASRAALLKEHIPEAMDFLKELHRLGMVDGLRAIKNVTVNGVVHGNS
ncbi:MAG: hypothetical protein NT086_09035 [Proteobacteria bacterium]|nr:hypothetical protein [Pseudomonadota bacterium]